jgi:SH3-like domain-containing protein
MKSDVMRGWVLRLVGVMLATGAAVATAAAQVPTGPVSGLPVPRFVSLKSDKVNVRAGPAREQDVAWVYSRAALPVEVTAEFENWRKIREWKAPRAGVYNSLLVGRRTQLVSPQSKGKRRAPFVAGKARSASGVTAKLQHGRARHREAIRQSGWCRLVGDGFDGWIEQPRCGASIRARRME